ncbi:PQQ-dependent sugar dehydrogenase, partial [bacterium]|nr:PQQ-dependent sugar dehydrogenase [bacterium]
MKAPTTSRRVYLLALLAIILSPIECVLAQSGLDQAQPFAAFLNGVFPPSTPGSIVPTTPGAGSWSTQNAFPYLSFPEPVRIVEHPRENKLAVVSKTGQIWMFANHPQTATKELLLDLGPLTNYPSVGEGGVTGLAFHPDFGNPASPNRGFIYVAYRHTPGKTGVQGSEQIGFNRIARFTVPDGGGTANLSSELVLIHQYDRQQWHVGGCMFFGSDGFLYIGVGDEGPSYSRYNSAQIINGGLWSGVLRIDVNNDPARSVPIGRQPRDPLQINVAGDSNLNPRPAAWPASFSQGYSIPLDNPFRDTAYNPAQGGQASTLGEFYAIGLRHPWTISQDPATGFIWYADVGENQREEIGRIVKGGNHQWAFREGLDEVGPSAQPYPLIGINSPPV